MWIFVLLIVGLVGCSSPTKEQQMRAARDSLVSEEMDLQQCENTKGYSSEQCAARRETYEGHLAAFRATYGR